METDETKQPETQPELPPSEGNEPLQGHPLDDAEPAPLHPTHALVIEAHAALKRGLEAFDRRGVGHAPTIDDVRLAFRALDALLAEVGTPS